MKPLAVMWHATMFGLSWLIAVLAGTFTEYVMHRVMHRGGVLRKRHAEHHRDNVGQGVFSEFRDYLLGGLVADVWIVGALAYLAPWCAAGFALGVLSHMLVASWAHQAQHERPELVFWMPRPVHHLHHAHKQWHHNFGISTDLWDRVFGTYDPRPWAPTVKASELPLRSFVALRWW